ncbi:MAG: hypothetical protein Q9220_006025 [cf. Caloplaca sp. 1 TL-2023]
MPTTKHHGTLSPTSKLIGGTPTIHYFDFASRCHGQVIRLLWEDAGTAYQDIRFGFDEWPEYKKTVVSQKNPTSNVPLVELNGRGLTQSLCYLEQTDRNRFLKALETHLSRHDTSVQGPYVIGKVITYADFVLYQIMHDEGLTKEGRKGLQEYPRLRKLVDAVEGRPNVEAFLESDRYLG